MFSKKPAPHGRSTTMGKAHAPGATFSVIGGDVTIRGDIAASADLHIDGRVEGDVGCTSLVQGEGSVIVGAVTAQTARLAGRVEGSISAGHLVVLKTARIEGDVRYDALTIEQGAQVEGRFAQRTGDDEIADSASPDRADADRVVSIAH